jgi:hypothetical protein
MKTNTVKSDSIFMPQKNKQPEVALPPVAINRTKEAVS